MGFPAVYEQLQAATTIHDSAQTLIGKEIPCGAFPFLSLFLNYTKGDETGLNVYAYTLHSTGGDEFQHQTWLAAAGTKTSTANLYQVTATGLYYITFDIRGISFVRFKQVKSAGATATGTLEAGYVLTES